MLNRLDFSNLKGDLLGGLTAAIVSLPLALTFGVTSGAGAEAGLYGAIMIGLFASLFGGTPTLISEPTGPMTVIMSAVITTMIAANPENGLAMAFTVVMIAGVFQILFGVLKLGRYITLMPHSVISGFMSGIGCILIIMQLGPFLGEQSPPGGVIGVISNLPVLFAGIKLEEISLALLALLILFFCPSRIKAVLPPQLLVLVLVTLLSMTLIGTDEINRIGEISVGLPVPQLPVFTSQQIQTMILDGMILGMLGCIDSMLTSLIADNLTRTEHKSNKELIGQGIGNIMSGLVGGLPGAGATMGTVVNIQTGGRTFLSGIFRAVVLIIAVYGASSLLELVPLSVLAAIAIKVGLDILDWSFIKRAHRVSWQSALVMYAVILLTVFVDLIVAVGVGIFVANILIIEKLSAAQQENIKVISDLDDALPLSAQEGELLSQSNGRVLLVYLSGPMIFGVVKTLSREHAQIDRHTSVIVDLSDVPMLDDTMSIAIENTILHALDLGKHVFLVVRQPALRLKLERMGTLALLPESYILETRLEALKLANQSDMERDN